MTDSAAARADAEAAIRRWCAESEVDCEAGSRPGELVVVLPGEAKLRTAVSLMIGERALRALAFVVRRPDENHAAFYGWMLGRNLRMPGIAFAVDQLGDVYLVGRLPLPAVTVDSLDELLGALLTASDGSFNDLLALGFLTSMQRELSWRLDRGESTRNLDAFMHLLTPAIGPADPTGPAPSGGPR